MAVSLLLLPAAAPLLSSASGSGWSTPSNLLFLRRRPPTPSAFLRPRPPPPSQLAAIHSLRNALSRSVVAPLCFAAISRSTASVNTPLTVVASGMAKWLELYSGVLMVRVLLSWFPNIPWERQPLQAIRDMCDPYLNLFRNIIPPIFNALDVSPLLAFLVLGMFASILNTTIQA